MMNDLGNMQDDIWHIKNSNEKLSKYEFYLNQIQGKQEKSKNIRVCKNKLCYNPLNTNIKWLYG